MKHRCWRIKYKYGHIHCVDGYHFILFQMNPLSKLSRSVQQMKSCCCYFWQRKKKLDEKKTVKIDAFGAVVMENVCVPCESIVRINLD